jgi:hypothetical protein
VRRYIGWHAAGSLRACRAAGGSDCCSNYGCAEGHLLAFTITDVNVHEYADPYGYTNVHTESNQYRYCYSHRHSASGYIKIN